MKIPDHIMKEMIAEMPRIAKETAELEKKYCLTCLHQKDCKESGIPENVCPVLNGENLAES